MKEKKNVMPLERNTPKTEKPEMTKEESSPMLSVYLYPKSECSKDTLVQELNLLKNHSHDFD